MSQLQFKRLCRNRGDNCRNYLPMESHFLRKFCDECNQKKLLEYRKKDYVRKVRQRWKRKRDKKHLIKHQQRLAELKKTLPMYVGDCLVCGKTLMGKQAKYCSKKCRGKKIYTLSKINTCKKKIKYYSDKLTQLNNSLPVYIPLCIICKNVLKGKESKFCSRRCRGKINLTELKIKTSEKKIRFYSEKLREYELV